MKTENESVEKLEIGKDYISIFSNLVVIDRKGADCNKGFWGVDFKHDITCVDPDLWREATPEDVKWRFEAHLVKRYGADWKTMTIKETHPSIVLHIDRTWRVQISKDFDGWNVWNKNGLVYSNGIWVERLTKEESPYEYILWNKPLLSLKDIDETIKIYSREFDELKRLAKERLLTDL